MLQKTNTSEEIALRTRDRESSHRKLIKSGVNIETQLTNVT